MDMLGIASDNIVDDSPHPWRDILPEDVTVAPATVDMSSRPTQTKWKQKRADWFASKIWDMKNETL